MDEFGIEILSLSKLFAQKIPSILGPLISIGSHE
jgi:hypothetical protein